MPLTVLTVAFPFAPMGPAAVGGAEQIATVLDEALTAAGHSSIVAASQESQVTGKLYAFPPLRPPQDAESRRWCRQQLQHTIDRALASEAVDLIHMHGMDFHEYTLPERIPVLVSLHLPIAWHPPQVWERTSRRMRYHCVSQSQRKACPPCMNEVVVIENGVPLPPPRPAKPRRGYALVMGRICPEKNAHAAVEAATLAGTPVRIAGRVFDYAEHQRYYREKLLPLLQRESWPRHEFVGPLTAEQRSQVLAEAKCLLHPTLAPETSSLVAMEAMAAGTPVIAYPSGALAEIVEDGVTGYLVTNPTEMAEAMQRTDAINPTACRATAERRFSRGRMVQQMFQLYYRMTAAPAGELRRA